MTVLEVIIAIVIAYSIIKCNEAMAAYVVERFRGR